MVRAQLCGRTVWERVRHDGGPMRVYVCVCACVCVSGHNARDCNRYASLKDSCRSDAQQRLDTAVLCG